MSVPATASPFQMAWLSFLQHYFLTLFPVCSLLSRGLGFTKSGRGRISPGWAADTTFSPSAQVPSSSLFLPCTGDTETSLNPVPVRKGIVLKSNLLKCVLIPALLWTHCWNLDLINSTWVFKWCDTFFRGSPPPHFLDQSLNHIHGNTERKKNP